MEEYCVKNTDGAVNGGCTADGSVSGAQEAENGQEKRVLTADEALRLAEFYKCFSDPTRIRLLYALSRSELSVGELAEAAGTSVSAVSHALKLLRLSRLVKSEKRGQLVIYSLDDDHIKTIFETGMTHLSHGSI